MTNTIVNAFYSIQMTDIYIRQLFIYSVLINVSAIFFERPPILKYSNESLAYHKLKSNKLWHSFR